MLRTTPTNAAGIGSVLAQLRSSAAIATMLGARLSTFSVTSEHPYRVASLLRLDLLHTQMGAGTRACSLMASPSYARILDLMGSWCNEVGSALADSQAQELQHLLRDCDLILDDRPWDVHYDMSKCTWRWTKQIFSTLGSKSRESGIGLHIRWGDMANNTAFADPLTPERSTPIETAAQLLRKLRECGVRDELSVYMESHNATMLSGLGEPYRIVDSGDDVGDLIDLASNKVLMLGISSYTVLAHQIAEKGITVVPNIDQFGINWHDNGVNRVLRWKELLSINCSDFTVLFNS